MGKTLPFIFHIGPKLYFIICIFSTRRIQLHPIRFHLNNHRIFKCCHQYKPTTAAFKLFTISTLPTISHNYCTQLYLDHNLIKALHIELQPIL